MRVFISWSGERSKAIAEVLREWLPNVIQAVEPWMSAEDIEKGTRWASDLASQLESTRIGVICLTPECFVSPWILFEAGALSKTLDRTYVYPYLFDINPSDLQGPLVQFQATKAEKDDTKRLMHTINRALGDKCLASSIIDKAFEVWWPRLEEKLENIRTSLNNRTNGIPKRSDREIYEETLELVRELRRDLATRKVYKNVGYVGVDSGQLIITDPGYLDRFKSDDFKDSRKGLRRLTKKNKKGNGFEYSYSGCCEATLSKEGAGQLAGWGWSELSKEQIQSVHEGKLYADGAFDTAGVAVSTGAGDGCYPVYVEYEGGLIKSVTVQFLE